MILVLGMMSGTSLDGVDAALIETDGQVIAGFGRSGFRAYDSKEGAVLYGALGQWPGGPGVADAAALSVTAHAALAADFPEAVLIGYHGQTLAHDPQGRGTHQAGDGAALARAVGRPVVWDFRTEDVRQGGEGAPLVPFFHHACARWAVAAGRLEPAPVLILNLGGVGNVTWLDPSIPAAEEATLAFDTGPANAPLNDLMLARCGAARDEGGVLALSGQADPAVVAGFLRHPFFDRPPPKSLDRDAWGGLVAAVAGLSDADAAATLTEAAAAAVGAGLRWLPEAPARLLVCGGGRHNGAMMAALARQTGMAPEPVEAIGLDGDMLEAHAFGWLAVRVMRGLPTSGPTTTGAPGPVGGGRISHPR
ncbi:MAG: anhydro-N-acetylmuramic acid kinase [Paracoccus sp. (in: a-proteobacteria)]|uniref:anhydro-N-acetylmuramic acid kinase n=1 Tax=Paracoccus sp. TaxID=267 RepID=UPI0026E03221|nr:anhydro-N-acetylmuramic acid kinase [Paracoccus sp. (in: a-proteobacteria)]MDO5620654.1 anhydro-N-acetylmuramic acid kinase [Paracoccus sp. (in: a-proteobacteria)]